MKILAFITPDTSQNSKNSTVHSELSEFFGLAGISSQARDNRECIQKFPDWTPGATTANGTALCP
jgi:hypothetical protein